MYTLIPTKLFNQLTKVKIHHQPSIRLLLILITICLCGTHTAAFAQCSQLRSTPDGLGYKLRNNSTRCEGLYESNVSGESLQIVSLLEGPLVFGANPDIVLKVSPALNTGMNVHVRAVPVPLKTYYRMDAELQPNTVLSWPVRDVLSRIGLSSSTLGVYGWIGGENDPIFIPLRVTPGGQARQAQGNVILGVRSSVSIDRASWRWANVENNQCSVFGGWQDIGVSGNTTLMKIPLTNVNSHYICVEVQAKERNSGSWLPPLILKIRRP